MKSECGHSSSRSYSGLMTTIHATLGTFLNASIHQRLVTMRVTRMHIKAQQILDTGHTSVFVIHEHAQLCPPHSRAQKERETQALPFSCPLGNKTPMH